MQGNKCRPFLPRESDEEFNSTSHYIHVYHIPEKNLYYDSTVRRRWRYMYMADLEVLQTENN